MSKAARTRQRILDAALRLFEERGFDGTTMRAIAKEAGVSVGNAYYHFTSKDALILGWYERNALRHAELSRIALKQAPHFAERLRAVYHATLHTIASHRRLAVALFRSTAEPDSPLNPFGSAGNKARSAAAEIYAEVITGSSDITLPKHLTDELPHLLWMLSMAFVLYWIHDRSPEAQATFLLIDEMVEMLTLLLPLAASPLMSGLVERILSLVQNLRALNEIP